MQSTSVYSNFQIWRYIKKTLIVFKVNTAHYQLQYIGIRQQCFLPMYPSGRVGVLDVSYHYP